MFPLLYLTLELPKRIINDAISSDQPFVDVMDYELDQVTFLIVLCVMFLVSVLAHGLTKMRINTKKGIVSERMLRRLRFRLISRILRFPQPYLRRTSQGEMVSMITSEAEPMGGMMGDAISLPVLQAGQMITILSFLFLQSVWFGLAAVALIPLQAWVIPKLQRQINLHNKDRIQEVRKLAGEIGESATGAATLRTHSGWRYRLARITRRLGTLFDIRLTIYKKKFFMKFLNNFITQLTPFFFYLVGGMLVIWGEVSLGALVAALAAYKDLSSPWKELLNYYNRVQDLSLRWELIYERFDPPGMVDEALFDTKPEVIPHLDGDIRLDRVIVRDQDGDAVLEDIDVTLPAGQLIGFAAADFEERKALADLLTREMLPTSGKVLINDQDINELHQITLSARVGLAERDPYLFQGTFGENVMMPLRQRPVTSFDIPEVRRRKEQRRAEECEKSGNSQDSFLADWVDPTLADVETREGLRDWWLEIMDAIGSGNTLFHRGLEQTFDEVSQPELAERLIQLRPTIRAKLEQADLSEAYYRFDVDRYNPALPVAANVFFATPRRPLETVGEDTVRAFMDVLTELSLVNGMLRLSQEVVEMLNLTFGVDGTDHPLFQRLGLDADVFKSKVDLAVKARERGLDALSKDEQLQLLTLPFEISSEQIGPVISDELREVILELRHKQRAQLAGWLDDHFAPLEEDHFAPGLSVLENAIYGTLPFSSTAKTDAIRDIVAQVLIDEGLKPLVAELIFAIPTGLGGAGLPKAFAEPLSISRAVIKRPDILILDGCMAGYTPQEVSRITRNLRHLLPKATIVLLEEAHKQPEEFDRLFEIEHGRLKDSQSFGTGAEDSAASVDLRQKMRALLATDLFSGLERKQLRLLAFGAQWFEAAAGGTIFKMGDGASDGAYLILEGTAELYHQDQGGARQLVAVAGPGTLVGELALIRRETRALGMMAQSDLKALRLGEEEFLAVVENDASTAFKIMQVLAGYIGKGQSDSDSDQS
nr:ABC transporter transmembrane domain-containing protein [uncultured Shimia sp.]